MKKRQRYEEILYDIGGFNCACGPVRIYVSPSGSDAADGNDILVGNLVVKTPELIARGQNISSEDNTFIPGDTGHDLGYWISDEVLAGYGIAPVEFGKMGPRE